MTVAVYNKPEIVNIGSAHHLVRSTMKTAGVFDAIYGQGLTANAYEADE